MLFSFVGKVLAHADTCALDQWLNEQESPYKELISNPKLYKQVPVSPYSLPPLKEAYWPLDSKTKNDLNFELIHSRSLGSAVHQSFSQITLLHQRIQFSALVNDMRKTWDLEVLDLHEYIPLQQERADCTWPSIYTWKTKNPFNDSLIFYIYVSALRTPEHSKKTHMEFYIDDQGALLWVPKSQHLQYGISSNHSILKYKKDFSSSYQDFRNQSGVIGLRFIDQCDTSKKLPNNPEDSSYLDCLTYQLENNIQENTWNGFLHTNERDAHWMGRLTLSPPINDALSKKMIFSSDIDLFYSDNKEDALVYFEFGGLEPKKINSNQSAKASFAAKWDKDHNFLQVRFFGREQIQVELLIERKESKLIDYGRIIHALYGQGNYLKP